jgi:hypothetical protein
MDKTDKTTISEEDKIILNYLTGRQDNIDSSYYGQNEKIAQILAINGVLFGIIAVTLDKIIGKSGMGINFMILGVILLFVSTVFALVGYISRKYDSGLPDKKEDIQALICDNIEGSTAESRLNKVKELIVDSIIQNTDSLSVKVFACDWAIYLEYFGLCFLLIGFFIAFWK